MRWLVIVPFLIGTSALAQVIKTEEVEEMQKKQYAEIERYLDRQLKDAPVKKQQAWQRDFTSIEAYERSIDPWRAKLAGMLGGMDYPKATAKPVEELVGEFPTHRAYRVWIPAFADVSVYGILLIPSGDGPFPAMVCIHGMSGSPEAVCGLTEKPDYHNRYGMELAKRGYVVFAPLDINNYKTRSWLDRKAIMIGERLQGLEQFKIRCVVDYLSERKEGDAKRIGAYGISWGGRTVMNAAAMDKRIAACAISGHFNDLIPKMVTPAPQYTAFIQTGEDYAFFWRHAELFSDADVVSLICPRPVFIEQGRSDRVVHWEMSQRAFGEVKAIYDKLGIGERAVYSIFEGPHEIRAVEAFEFFDRWLKK